MIYLYCSLAFLCLLLCAGFLCVRVIKPTQSSLVLKTMASLMFVIIGVISIVYSNSAWLNAMFVLGLVFGLVGDILLDLKVMTDSKMYLNIGTLCFGFGHILYFIGILCYISTKIVTGFWWVAGFGLVFSLLCGLLIVKLSPSLKLDLTGFKWQSMLYVSLLIFMTIISFCLALVLPICYVLFAGFALFLISDLILSQQYFGGKQNSKLLTILNHVTYYMAQLLIAGFIFFI